MRNPTMLAVVGAALALAACTYVERTPPTPTVVQTPPAVVATPPAVVQTPAPTVTVRPGY